MKKQLILLLVASAIIGDLDAAAVRNAAKTAFTSGGRAFTTSALPKGVSNIAKQTARFKTFDNASNTANNAANREWADRKFAQSGPIMNSAWGSFKNWFNNLFANRSHVALATGTAALGGAATYGWLKSQPVAFAEEEKIAEELKSRINEFEPFSYQKTFINDKAQYIPKGFENDYTYEIKAVETPEDIRLYIKNPRLVFDQSINSESVFVTDFTGRNLILVDKSKWPGQETKLQLPEKLLPNTQIKYIRISDNEIEFILPRNPGDPQTINVFKPHGSY
jgi:hypothetical protein